MKWIKNPCPALDPLFKQQAIERQSQLTKPPGSLGQLENIAIRLASLQQQYQPTIDSISIAIFAADHGVVKEGISAFPQEVTTQMVLNFLNGGAAISVLASQLNAHLEVIDVGIYLPDSANLILAKQANFVIHRAGNGTANSSKVDAMSDEQLQIAFQAGYDTIERCISQKTQLFIGGEMGIGNTTTAAALYCALLGLTPEQATGAGTGLDNKSIQHKTKVVQQIIDQHKSCGDNTLEWLRSAGGFEIAALTGAYIHAAQSGLPVLVDGFISSVAALCAVRILPEANKWLFFSHVSAEQGHRLVLETLEQTPLLDLGLRLGEASGAAITVPLLRSACALHNEMATFSEAAVATKL